MGQRYASNGEPNLMMYNFSRASAVYRFLELARDAIRKGKFNGIDHRLIHKAKAEFDEFRKGLDAETPYFSHELADMALGADTRRKIILVQGRFEGDYDVKNTIGLDLGIQPYRLYKPEGRSRYETLDDYITKEAVRDYLRKHHDELKRRGVEGFRVRHSAFFSVRDTDLRTATFRNANGALNMEQLLPLIADTILNNDGRTGYIGISLISLPDYRFYAEHSPSFTSNRIKSSLGRKVIKQLLLSEIKPEDVITDTGAHRLVVESLDVVRDLESRIRQGTVGKSTIQIIPEKTKDKYKKPENNGYRGLKLVVYVTTRGKRFVREIQLVDAAQYYRNEMNPNDSAHHVQQEKKEESSVGQKRRIPEQILEAIQEIFGRSSISITLKDAMKS